MSKKAIHIVLPLVCLLFCFKTYAQNNIPVLSWQTHFSYKNINSLALGENTVFAAASHGIFFLDLDDNSINLINKNNGLSDVDIASVHYSNLLDALIIGYKDGEIDFWRNGTVQTISTVEKASITGSKAYRNIQSFNNRLYFSGDLGVVVYDIQREQITESYLNLGENGTRLPVNELYFKNDSIYAATDNGILSALNDESVNLLDFNNWSRSLTGLDFLNIIEFDDKLYASSGSDIFNYDGTDWNYFTSITQDILALDVNENNLFALSSTSLYQLNGSNLQNIKNIVPANGMSIEANTIWVASSIQGLSRHQLNIEVPQNYRPLGPLSDEIDKSFYINDELYFLNEEGYSIFKTANRTWEDFGSLSSVNLSDLIFNITLPTSLDPPLRSDFTQGIFSARSSVNLLLDFTNQTTMERINGSFNIQAMESFNSELWAATRDRDRSLHKWNLVSDTWSGYELSNRRARFPTDLFIANNGDKWMNIDENEGGGILVFNEASGRERYLNVNGGQGGLPGRKVNDIAYDEDEFLWFATSGGVAFYPSPDEVLENRSLTASIPIFENRLLLRNEHITSISIDPANRKWFGSLNNGLWLFSETGEELIYHFTEENSPLPSNQIVDITLNPKSGELFISTDKGTVSFRSDATEGQASHSNVKIYPNPVSPSFQGNVILEGLVNNARLKITDVSGKLVKDIRANGSTAIWNVRDLSNARVSTGVYLVFSSNRDGSETFVGKIVVI